MPVKKPRPAAAPRPKKAPARKAPTAKPPATRAGYVALLGAPNAGKSTLLNGMVGEKLSIVSPKAQTTRARVLGLVVDGTTQMGLLDTPGLFAPKRGLDRAMVQAAWAALDESEAALLLVDASNPKGVEASLELRRLSGWRRPPTRKASKRRWSFWTPSPNGSARFWSR